MTEQLLLSQMLIHTLRFYLTHRVEPIIRLDIRPRAAKQVEAGTNLDKAAPLVYSFISGYSLGYQILL